MLYRINQKNKVDTLSVERIKTRKVKTENEKQNKSKRQARYENVRKRAKTSDGNYGYCQLELHFC